MRLSWKIYSCGYAIFVLLETSYSLFPNTPTNVYYKILISFNKAFIWQYILYYIKISLEVFGLAPLFLFVFKKKWLLPIFWKIFFFTKIVGLFLGNNYECRLVKTFFAVNKIFTLALLLSALLIILPYYVVLYLFAFKQKELKNK
ncbi:MAG: hypothetical protein Q8O13_05095 [Candidatus Omnitrophota bacterium]|nr:hypothetical protein [Candidatus Omnitrophota bacterium]